MQDSEIFFLTNGGKILSGVDELNCPAELRVPFGVTKIERRALADCPAKKIFLPDTVTQIGYEAFSGCDALEYVRFPKKIESVEPSIFRGCFSLQKVELGDEILELSENMFECCYSLEEAPFRSGILELPRNVFSECVSLKSLVIPEGVAVIKSGAAAYCQNLSTLVLPSSIKVIEDDAFRSCVSLAHIRFSAENPVFFTDEDSGTLFEKHEDGTFSLIKVPVNAKQIRIPKNITHSHSEAFQGCDSIEKVFIDCALTDHPLFVALKTEIVDAHFIDETQITPETKSESQQKKPRNPRAKKSEVT
ncbi:MAG: leucine-rich repeat domain-containing protein, partial [Treponemataceae bacterium]|nr:leucine-rich repeat domain-containing protein [Treponemataceae bacterium]